MAKRVKIELPDDSFFVEFQGDTPTLDEQIKLANLIKSRQSGQGAGRAMSREQMEQAAAAAKDEQLFDTTSGIKDAGLRAKLSAAETKGDAEAQLRVLYNMTEEDYTRDSRGRLALTPSGGAKIGVELSQPTLIDEDKFTRYDLADFAGVVPEIVGGVGGGVGGAILGAPAGPLGMLLVSALGAGIGSSAGQALEEGIEAKLGVQTQTAEEVRKDLETEFKIGFLSDFTLGAFGLFARGVGSTMRAGKGLTPEELEIAAKSIEMGINPTLSAIRAPSVVARQQGIVEKIFGSSPRLKQNNEVMQNKLAEYRSKVDKTSDEEVGRILLEGTGAKAAELESSQLAAQKAVLQTLRGLGDDLGAAAERNAELGDDVFEILIGARNAFDSEVKKAFKPIDLALDDSAGSKKLFDIENIRTAMKEIREREKTALRGKRTMRELESALNSLDALGKRGNVSFLELYNARKTLSDTLAQTPFGDRLQRGYINDLMRKIDSKLSKNNLKSRLDSLQMPEGMERDILIKASEAIDPARKLFNEGAQIFEDIESAGIIKNLAAKVSGNQTIGIDDVAMDKIIRNNKPKVLQRALAAVEYASRRGVKGKGGESLNTTEFRQQLAGQWLNDALSTSGLSRVDDFDPAKFKPAAFAKSVKDLGKTADVLFGENANKIKSLAAQMEKIGLSDMKQVDMDAIIAQIGDEAPLVDKLQALVQFQRAARDEKRSAALRDLQRGDLNYIQASNVIADRSTTATDIKKIFNAFEGDEEALQKIRGNYMERLVSDFGDSITTDGKSLGAFAKRLLDADEGGKLSAIFGEEMGKDMAEFAKILAFNARTAAGGDLVAANIAASPIQNLGKLAKFTIIGRLLQSGPYYKQIVKDYKKLAAGETAETKARILGRLIAQSLGQQSQEGVREAEQQAGTVIGDAIDTTGIGQQIQQLQQQVTNPNNFSGMAQAPVVPPQQPAAQPTLRQRAAQNPAVARTLGITGGTAGLI
ncbi:MAG TPA: hypothetical protein DCW74_14670 [Alteromonas australica]|uniref:Uncharacterized protein n=1 Tax=Alteromonas australica TaxID=589873 RepID=A0A350P6P7_9ALTE|nr:hypothetical protein [Alteromonas australica]